MSSPISSDYVCINVMVIQVDICNGFKHLMFLKSHFATAVLSL